MSPHDFDVLPTAEAVSIKLLQADLDGEAAQRVCRELSRLADASGLYRVRVDMTRVGFVNAAALGTLITFFRKLQDNGGSLFLHNVHLPVFEVFKLARLVDVFDVRQTSVLVVEDDAQTRETLRTILEYEGYGVACSGDGREALARLRGEDRPALILLDLIMTGMDGWEFRQEQRRDEALAPIPVVLVSGTDDVPGSAAALGAAGYLRKPVHLEDLLQVVKSACGTGA
ncbi:MAG TPA: response regulator [Gemmataceae bacterium]|nr:response regulator [Gemmataceae bacterium]